MAANWYDAKREHQQGPVEFTHDTGRDVAGTPRDRRRQTSVAAVVLVLISFPQVARAHHVAGLPHAAVGPYDIVMTTIPEKPLPGKAAHITFYIIDSNTGRSIDESIAVRVLQSFTFSENQEIARSTEHLPVDRQYQYQVDFPEDGEYLVELTLDVEGKTETISFLLIVGEPTGTTSIVIAIGAGLIVFFIIVRAIKVRRNRMGRQSAATSEQRPSLHAWR